jgi:tetraacyldisaccharide 4'-kinase
LRSLHEILNNQYYKKSSWILFLLPLSFIYFLIISFRSWAYKIGIFKSIKMDVPVVVIGNITIGGTGKTPLAIWLLEKLIKKDMKPGLICSGYRSKAKSPQEVLIDSKVSNVGDEALMIKLSFQRRHNINIPIFVGKKKAQVGMALLNAYPDIDILISDDGLQHYELLRDFEIVVIDEVRRFGNKFLIPTGPLREPKTRLNKVDAVIVNSETLKVSKSGYGMTYFGGALVNCLQSNHISELDVLDKEIVAITGIGNPERFFEQLTTSGLKFKKVIFNDHHLFTEFDFKDYDDMDIIMTEKDAVKCKSFAKENFWYLPIYADVEEKLFKKLIKKLRI